MFSDLKERASYEVKGLDDLSEFLIMIKGAVQIEQWREVFKPQIP